jgi:hypothetical protein
MVECNSQWLKCDPCKLLQVHWVLAENSSVNALVEVDASLQIISSAYSSSSNGSLPIRVGRQFAASRKLGRTHQNVLVFCKGDPKRATEACGQVEFGEIEEEAGEEEDAE